MSACQGCVYRGPLPGDAHITCLSPAVLERGVVRPALARWPGCGSWPVNFDEAIVKACPHRSEDEADRERARVRGVGEEIAAVMLRRLQFVALCNGYEAAALLSCLLCRHAAAGEAEFCVADRELEDELRLSEGQLRRARARLGPMGVATTRRGLPARLWYRIDTDVLESLLRLRGLG